MSEMIDLKHTNRFTAVDPGANGCGVASFRISYGSWVLSHAEYVRLQEKINPVQDAASLAADIDTHIEGPLVIEVPKIYPAARQKGDQNDLIRVALVAGAVGGYANEVCGVPPRDWKGTIDPDVCIARVKARLSPQEVSVLNECACPKSLLHNVIDAIGIGLWAVGRFSPKKIYPGAT